MKKLILNLSLFFVAFSFSFCTSNTEVKESEEQLVNITTDKKVEVIQFHSEHRCTTCNDIESITKSVLENYKNSTYTLINLDEEVNKEMANEFQAAGTALFLYNSETGVRQELTDFAFMNAHKVEDFKKGLTDAIEAF